MRRIYLIGICGTGMSALAGLLKEKGFEVGGSDRACFPPVRNEIEKLNLKLYENFSEKNIKDFEPDLVIIGNIVGRGNPEGEFVLNKGYEFLSMPEALRYFFLKDRERIVVAGTHGKTTTASLLAYSLEKAGFAPGFFIGGIPVNSGKNYRLGNGKFFVVEGDEYETSFFDKHSKFFHYFPNILILKSLEYDHVDIFSSEKEYVKAFKFLLREIPSEGKVFFPSSSKKALSLVPFSFSKNITYGKKKNDDVFYELGNKSFPYVFEVFINNRRVGEFELNLIGEYNIENALPSIYFLYENGVKIEKIKKIIADFKGVKRRQEILYDSERVTLIDDFAHHPTSIEKTIKSVKNSFPDKKILTIFEPASWSLRKKIFQKKLVNSLKESDLIYILDIKGKEKIPCDDRLNLKAMKKSLIGSLKEVSLFEGKMNRSEIVVEKVRRDIKDGNYVILILSNSTRLNLEIELREALKNRREKCGN